MKNQGILELGEALKDNHIRCWVEQLVANAGNICDKG
jgi:hypothetical protein